MTEESEMNGEEQRVRRARKDLRNTRGSLNNVYVSITETDRTMNVYSLENNERQTTATTTTATTTSALFPLFSLFQTSSRKKAREEQQHYHNTTKPFSSIRATLRFSSLLFSPFLLHLLKFRRALASPSPSFIICKWKSIIIRLFICNTILITIPCSYA